MFESYAVGVTLRLHNFVTPALLQIGQEFKGTELIIDSLRASMKATELQAKSLAAALRSVNAATPGRRSAAATAADETATAFDKATQAAQRYKNTMQGASMAAPHAGAIHPTSPLFAHAVAAQQSAIAATMGSSLATQMAIAQRISSTAMTHHLPGLLAQQAVMAGGGAPPYGTYPAAPHLAGPAGMPYTPFRMRTPGGVGGAGGGGGGGGGPGPHLVPPGGGSMMPMMAPMGAMLPMAGAAGAVYAGQALFKASRDYELAFTRFRGLNFGEEANKQADDFARRSRVPGVSSQQLMDTLSESVGLFGSMPNALKLAPKIAQLNAANSALFSGKIGTIDAGVAQSIGRFNDMRGLTNGPEDFERGLNLAQRLVVSSGGATKFKDLEQLAKRGGAAFKGMSDEGIVMLSSYLQEQGGNSAGTSLMSFYQNLNAGRTTKGAMAALEKAELIGTKLVKSGAVGGKKSQTLVVDWIKDEELLRTNAPLWMMTYFPAAAAAAGKKTNSEIINFVNDMVSNRRGSDMAGNHATQQDQIRRDAANTNRAWGTDQTIAEYGKTAGGKQDEFIAAWRSFKVEFGTAALPAFTKILTTGSGLLRDLNIFMESSGAKSFIGMYEKGFKFQGSAIGGLTDAYRKGFSAQGDMLGKAGNFLFGDKQATGAPVVGQDTEGGAFTGYRVPMRTSASRDRHVTINNTIVMPDGRVLAKVVTQEQGKELNRPQTGPRTADGRMSLRAFDLANGG